MFLQRTISKQASVEGVGLHSGKVVRLTFKPGAVNTGVHFVRADLPNKPSLAAKADNIRATSYATTLGGPEFSIATVEHCLAALAVLRIDNLVIELNGPEIPVCDGSAFPFWKAITDSGVVEQEQPRKYIYVTQPIYLGTEEKHAYVAPYNGLRLTCTIDFPHPRIRHQRIDLDINPHSFETQLAKARTFGFLKDVELMKSKGLALGGSLDNAVVLDADDVMNPEGLRFDDEFVRHKAMDALGDLVTLGAPLLGHVVLYKTGHDLNSQFVKKVLASTDSYRLMELGTSTTEKEHYGRWAWATQGDSLTTQPISRIK